MTITVNTDTAHTERAHSPLTGVHAVWWAIAFIAGDRLVTLLWWQHEANELVAQLGMYRWGMLTVGMVTALLVAWYPMGMRDSRLGQGCVWLLTALHALAVVSNLSVVTGVL